MNKTAWNIIVIISNVLAFIILGFIVVMFNIFIFQDGYAVWQEIVFMILSLFSMVGLTFSTITAVHALYDN